MSQEDTKFELAKLRKLFPITDTKTYLMNAALSPLNANGRRAMDEYLDLSQTDVIARPDVRQNVKSLLSQLLGGKSDDYALTTSTGHGMSMVAAGLEVGAGDNIVLAAGEHWNATFPWLNLKSKGVEVRVVQPDENNRVGPNAFMELCDEKTRAICVTAVRFDTGFRYDLKALSELAHEHDALLIVDGTQCAGANDLNVVRDGVDVLAGAGFKWLLGMAGTGYLYVNEEARRLIRSTAPGMYAAEKDFEKITYYDDARRYETGTIANLLFHGWSKGLELLLDYGIGNVVRRNRKLTDLLIAGLGHKNVEIVSPHASYLERSAIVAFLVSDPSAQAQLNEKLLAANVLISTRGDTIRVSPNFFNTEVEIEKFLHCI